MLSTDWMKIDGSSFKQIMIETSMIRNNKIKIWIFLKFYFNYLIISIIFSAIDMRRLPAEGRMLNLGNKINEQILLDNVLMKWPTLNIGSIYSITMCPATGFYNTTLHWSWTILTMNEYNLIVLKNIKNKIISTFKNQYFKNLNFFLIYPQNDFNLYVGLSFKSKLNFKTVKKNYYHIFSL